MWFWFAFFPSLSAVAAAKSRPTSPSATPLPPAYGASGKSDGYVPLFFSFLGEDRDEDLSLRNLAVERRDHHVHDRQGQFGMALAELRFRNQDQNPKNDVFVVTIDIGDNDILDLAGRGTALRAARVRRRCRLHRRRQRRPRRHGAEPDRDPPLASHRRRPGRQDIRPRLLQPLLGHRQAARGRGRHSSCRCSTSRISDVAASPGIDADVVHTFAAFEGKGGELTNVNGPEGDFHPNDDGYRLLADLLIDAYKR